MKYFYFLLVGVVALAGFYTLFGIGYFKWINYQVHNPKADFLVIDNQDNKLTIVDFTNYRCDYCKKIHKDIKEVLRLHKDIRYIPRPVLIPVDPDAQEKQEPVDLEKLAMAAGMQGKFQEMHDVFMEYPEGIIPEDVIKETADLYGIDYEKMVEDAKSEKVEDYLDDNVSDMMGTNIQSIPSYVIGKKIYIVGETILTLQDLLKMVTNEKNSQ